MNGMVRDGFRPTVSIVGEPNLEAQTGRAAVGHRHGTRTQVARKRTADGERRRCLHLVQDAGGAERQGLTSGKAADTEHSHAVVGSP